MTRKQVGSKEAELLKWVQNMIIGIPMIKAYMTGQITLICTSNVMNKKSQNKIISTERKKKTTYYFS